MRVLVTGSAGFIGSVISRKLNEQGHLIVAVDKKTGDDARDFFRRDEEHFDLVVHCAAQVGGRILIESPMAHAENLEIDAALFRWAERTKPGRIVYISSVAAYPARYQKWPGYRILSEEDISLEAMLAPDELYGWAKLTGELMAARCSIPVSIPRPFTVYGEGQDPRFPFANIAQQVLSYAKPVTVWGSGNQVRDFIHVDDVADGIIAMAEQGIDGSVNFCSGRGTSLLDLAGMIIAFKSRGGGYRPLIEKLRDKPEGLSYRLGNPARLHEFYKPKITLEEGIERALRYM